MIQIDLSNSTLFKNLIELEAKGVYVDLHNDYMCNSVKYNEKEGIKIGFVRMREEIEFHKVFLSFESVEIVKMSLPFQKDFYKEITLDNFYRGRFVIDNELLEFSKTGKAYYYLEFYEDYSIEFFAISAKALLYE